MFNIVKIERFRELKGYDLYISARKLQISNVPIYKNELTKFKFCFSITGHISM